MLSAPDKRHAKYPHVCAIVRFNLFMSGENAATVVKVIPTQELADEEAVRLNEVNKGKQCVYKVQVTRFVERHET